MKYRSKANPRVTIEAMRWVGYWKFTDEVFAEHEKACAFIGGDRQVDIHGMGAWGENPVHGFRLSVEAGGFLPGDWITKDANGHLDRQTHEEFEAEWEPLE